MRGAVACFLVMVTARARDLHEHATLLHIALIIQSLARTLLFNLPIALSKIKELKPPAELLLHVFFLQFFFFIL